MTAATKKLAVFSGATCLIALGILSGIGYVVYTKNRAYDHELRLRATRTAAERETESLGALLAETAEDRAMLARYVLTEDSVVDFLSLVEWLARENGMTAETRSLAVEEIEGNTVFESLTLEVNVTGSFVAVTRMLALVEALPYQVQVRRVRVERVGEVAGADLWHGAYRVYVTKYQ